MKININSERKRFITGYYGCSCHPFDNWEDLKKAEKQKFNIGDRVSNRCVSKGMGIVVEKLEKSWYRVQYGYEKSGLNTEHVTQLTSYQAYTKWEIPKRGLFACMVIPSVYDSDNKPLTQEEEFLIIGEDSISYIYDIRSSDIGKYYNEKVIKVLNPSPIGVNKKRLIKWLDTQLNLF